MFARMEDDYMPPWKSHQYDNLSRSFIPLDIKPYILDNIGFGYSTARCDG